MTDPETRFQRAQLAKILNARDWQGARHAELVPGERFAFYVDSHDGNGNRYLVRLDALLNKDNTECNGECGCDDFQIRCLHNFRTNGGEIVDHDRASHINRTRCKHIRTAGREFQRLCVMAMRTNELNED